MKETLWHGRGLGVVLLCSALTQRRRRCTAVQITRRRCRVRLCVPRGDGAPLGASMLRLNDAVVSNAAPTGTAARPSKKTARNSPMNSPLRYMNSYSRTRFYAIDVHRACKVWLYPKKFLNGYPFRETKGKVPGSPALAHWAHIYRLHAKHETNSQHSVWSTICPVRQTWSS